jgi:hypothetical protein
MPSRSYPLVGWLNPSCPVSLHRQALPVPQREGRLREVRKVNIPVVIASQKMPGASSNIFSLL